ncbi:tRNA uracil 4-sulfurtransferase ThiI [Ruminococcus sp. FC2018]|uniref:tRNA uracil 4-sulfurtransferase ThiI n=1 Tax=Ruminococcus sp. FC2018 TaxID=1410617 RepID=UPI00048E07E1|nr:tRNA uracil 4-sulfurtransferase ThiI [Ruminococcus sp. FC2018]
MKEIILCKYGEIALKGLNKSTFESMMMKSIRRRLKKFGEINITRAQSTVYVEPVDENIDVDEVVDRLSKIFGIIKLCRCCVVEKTMDAILNDSIEYIREDMEAARTFKVDAKRSDKKFPFKSPDICNELGGKLLETFPHLSVDVHKPDVTVTVEVREKYAFIHAGKLDGAGGIPVGSSGKAMLLLSGGIDSPVAGYMMSKRGAVIDAIHFEAPPYTSERAKQKVEKLAKKMTEYCGDIAFYCVPFTEIQETLRDKCPEELFTILMRRLMMEIAQRIAAREGCQALITGESLGQVASQTMYAMVCTDAVCRIPVFRPCVGLDKTEIIDISRKIDTFETSILPYEDCCTVFTPKHPKTRPELGAVEAAQARVDWEELIQKAVGQTTCKMIKLD